MMNGLSAALFGDEFCDALFGAEAEIKAMLRVEAALAKAQAIHGVIPSAAAEVLFAQLPEMEIPPQELFKETARNGVPVPALLTAIRSRLPAGDAGQWLHWGATSQDIVDTALVLRLRELAHTLRKRLDMLCRALGQLAQSHSDLPMAGRSFGQIAAPTTFGGVVASWGAPLLRWRDHLDSVSQDMFKVSLGGAVGNLSAMGEQAGLVRAALAAELELADPGANWHTERDSMVKFAGWLAGVGGALSKFAEDIILLAQTGIDEITIAGAGGSSTMPQKQNPVRASVIVALARQNIALTGVMHGAASHHQNRDGAAWFTEWLVLPTLCTATAAALHQAVALVSDISPAPAAMQRNLNANGGLVFAEALAFALAQYMPRTDAQRLVKEWCLEAAKGQESLLEIAKRQFPDSDWDQQVRSHSAGDSSLQARRFSALALT